MLKECRSHGYFREEFCPHCGDEGKFLLNDEEVEILMEAGLRPAARTMVHLSATFEAALEAGRVRIAQPLILEIDAKTARESGVVIHRAGKTVYTSKEIPNEFLRRSTRVEEELSPDPPKESQE